MTDDEPDADWFFHDSNGHLWVDASAVKDNGGVVIDRPDTDHDLPLEEGVNTLQIHVNNRYPELLVETGDPPTGGD